MPNKKEISVLIVDDDYFIRELLQDFLKSCGYRTATAENGTEAIKKIKKEHFNVVICDVEMPGGSGLEVLKQIRVIDSKINVIMMTGNGNEQYHSKSMSLGASGFIGKPFDLNKMLAVIENSTGK